jgi:hypothetical protein
MCEFLGLFLSSVAVAYLTDVNYSFASDCLHFLNPVLRSVHPDTQHRRLPTTRGSRHVFADPAVWFPGCCRITRYSETIQLSQMRYGATGSLKGDGKLPIFGVIVRG